MGDYKTALVKITDTYAPMVEQQLSGNGVSFDSYQKTCVVNAISAINTVLDSKGISWNDAQLDSNNLTQTLMHVAALKLNAAASPREVYFQLRNSKRGEKWVKQIEMGIEGDGNDAILRNFGADIKKVGQFWMVRENDEFSYPSFAGFTVQAPRWTPKGTGKVVRVVYPVLKNDGTEEYHIAERADVVRNLIAHVNNNLMNETFGIAKDRYKATDEQKKKINAKKQSILKAIEDKGLDTALDDPELSVHMSPAWTDPQSRESMIIRKMRNNVVKKIPKDFGNAFVEMVHSEESDPEVSRTRRKIREESNSEPIDVEWTEEDTTAKETEPEKQTDMQPEPETSDDSQEPQQAGLDINEPETATSKAPF